MNDDQPLQWSSREQCWVLPGAFFVPYFCYRPFTREFDEFHEKYMVPAMESAIVDIDKFFALNA